MKWRETIRCETTWGEYVSWRNYNATPATFPYMIFLQWWPFCIRHHFTFVFVLSVAVIVRFAIESFCFVFSCLFRDWDRWFYKDHRSFFNFYMFYEYNRLFCRNVFFTLSAAHSTYSKILTKFGFIKFNEYVSNAISRLLSMVIWCTN